MKLKNAVGNSHRRSDATAHSLPRVLMATESSARPTALGIQCQRFPALLIADAIEVQTRAFEG